MKKQFEVFSSKELGSVRVIYKDGEPLFIAKDVCKCLGISNSRQALTRLDADEKGVISTDTLGGMQDLSYVTESGLYGLVLGSRKPSARAFQKWVTGTVLVSIRKNGAYVLGQEEMSKEEAEHLYSEVKKLREDGIDWMELYFKVQQDYEDLIKEVRSLKKEEPSEKVIVPEESDVVVGPEGFLWRRSMFLSADRQR